MPLAVAPVGATLKVKKVLGDPKVKKHLSTLGIIPEEDIILLSLTNNGAIVLVNNTRLAIDNRICNSIVVSL